MIDDTGVINNGYPYFNPDIYIPADTTAPVITLTGDATVTVEVGTVYTDAGANASDDTDGDLTTSIVTDLSNVNTNVVGSYTITYNVSDAAGNAATQVSRTVNVVDTTAPVITLAGDATVTVEVGAIYTDSGANATDNYDGDLTTSIVTDLSNVNTNVVGSYTITYNVSDAAGNAATQVSRTVNVVDTTAPVITLAGDATVTVEVGAIYTDSGANATDNYDGDLTTSIITDLSNVNTNVVGSYTITYNVSDAAGNAATQVSRTVNVVDTTAPVITLTGDATVTVEVGAIYTDSGANATDNYDGDLTTSIVTDLSNVNTNVVGSYTITYNVSDATGNAATQVSRTVNVVDTTAPVITLTGDATVTVEVGAIYTELGAKATDNYDTAVTVVIGGDTVDTSTVGSYTVTYDATDANNNAATQVTRTVNVEEGLSIKDLSNPISIYPNPVTEYLYLNTTESSVTQIFDISGKLIQTSSHHKIDVSFLKSGVYLLKINTKSGKVHLQRVIKM